MSKDELRLYYLAWQDSVKERDSIAGLEPSAAIDRAYRRACADEEYDRANYLRLRAAYLAQQPPETPPEAA